ncbi:hypothetical protein [Mycobacterium sp.]|uniref:hypothetical protein n=1 Tax=Mycobacterium sp. TaxID=1785 RepID=UPI002BB7E946|nr:hypothetical protein [Mycobacterium sp.]HTH90681.1 hypothetical protein [Mycobacterium sp.]
MTASTTSGGRTLVTPNTGVVTFGVCCMLPLSSRDGSAAPSGAPDPLACTRTWVAATNFSAPGNTGPSSDTFVFGGRGSAGGPGGTYRSTVASATSPNGRLNWLIHGCVPSAAATTSVATGRGRTGMRLSRNATRKVGGPWWWKRVADLRCRVPWQHPPYGCGRSESAARHVT